MSDIPHEVLSEGLAAHLEHRRPVSALFLTYQFDPGFFEQEILPTLFDTGFSNATTIRLLQLDDRLRDLPGEIEVYYDAKGLVPGQSSSRLDIRRIPIAHPTGIFHPKNVFILLESADSDEEGERERCLLVGTTSANLTQSGWWENVEVAAFQVIEAGAKTSLREDLLVFLSSLARRAPAGAGREGALGDVLAFLRRETVARVRRSDGGWLNTRFYGGAQSIVEFLQDTAGNKLRGLHLDVVSPFFDETGDCRPLEDLAEAFDLAEVRVSLPRGPGGEALCAESLYRAVGRLPNTKWGRLPADRMRSSKSVGAAPRPLHAKVYRFFGQRPNREYLFIGSPNLTQAAHNRGGNLETGVLLESEPKSAPESWLEIDAKKPSRFEHRDERTDEVDEFAVPIALRYDWEAARAECLWLAKTAPPECLGLAVDAQRFEIAVTLSHESWQPLPSEIATALQTHLLRSSFVKAWIRPDEEATLLIQEDGMAKKPSTLAQELTLADILKYWSLLTPQQRAAFIEARFPAGVSGDEGEELMAKVKETAPETSLFDRFAGCFHAFSMLEHAVRQALDEGRTKDVDYRLFGEKYDSLPTLLARLDSGKGAEDPLDRYVMALCAQQMLSVLEREEPDFWEERSNATKPLRDRVRTLAHKLRESLLRTDARVSADYLNWFEKWFLRRAQPMETTP